MCTDTRFTKLYDYTEIKTERLYLRSLIDDDAELVRSYSGEFETDKEALEWIHWVNNRTDICFMFYIWLTQTNDLIGRVYFHSKAGLGGEVEIGYGISEKHRCKNYATEASNAVVQFAFGQAGQKALSAIIKPENAASRRVVEKLGFMYCGVRTILDNGEDCEFDYFKLLHTE